MDNQIYIHSFSDTFGSRAVNTAQFERLKENKLIHNIGGDWFFKPYNSIKRKTIMIQVTEVNGNIKCLTLAKFDELLNSNKLEAKTKYSKENTIKSTKWFFKPLNTIVKPVLN